MFLPQSPQTIWYASGSNQIFEPQMLQKSLTTTPPAGTCFYLQPIQLVPAFGIIRKHENTADRYYSFESTEDCYESGTFSKIYYIQTLQQLSVYERVLRNTLQHPEATATVGINCNSWTLAISNAVVYNSRDSLPFFR